LNRTTVLLLALGLLAAHALTLQQDPTGGLGTISDRAYVALRLGRNLVHSGELAWTPGGAGGDGYPSTGWVLWVALAERFYISSLAAVRLAGALGALLLVVIVSRFTPRHRAGIIAPLLLVVSGTTATAALDGTEWTSFACATALALWAVEELRPRLLVGALAAAIVLRPEGTLLVPVLALSHNLVRARELRIGWKPFVAAGSVALAWGLLRARLTGVALPIELSSAIAFDSQRVSTGAAYVTDFLLRAGWTPLIVAPIVLCFGRHHSSGRAARTLILGIAWVAWLAWAGGDELPFWGALLPAIVPLALATQDALMALVHNDRASLRALGWLLFMGGLGASALASKEHVDIGPLPLAQLQTAWQGADDERAVPALDVGPSRAGQAESVRRGERLRCLGIFVRDTLPDDATVLTPWPGAIGYLSRMDVLDFGGRAEPIAGTSPHGWFGPLRGDALEALRRRPGYILPSLQLENRAGSRPVLEGWLSETLEREVNPAAREELSQLLGEYTPIAVPVPVDSHRPHVDAPEPYVVLQHRSVGDRPLLDLEVDGDSFKVELRHWGSRQVASLVVEAVDNAGRIYSLTPTGTFAEGGGRRARHRLLVYSSGHHPVRLVQAELPRDPELVLIRARLALPFASEASQLREALIEEWDAELELGEQPR
jgi:hypothetical protein